MMRCIKIELYKALHNKYFFSALLIGVIVSLMNVAHNIEIVSELTEKLIKYIEEGRSISSSVEGFSLFIRWIATNGFTYGSILFFFIWPILAAIPYGWSYCKERRDGYYNQVVIRATPRTYYYAKYLAVFTSGGLAVSIPVLFDLLVNALVCPVCIPDVTLSLLPIQNRWFLSHLIYTSPWLYAIIWCTIDFLWGGVTACMCFIIGAKFRMSVIGTLIPFVLYILLDSVITIFRTVFSVSFEISPLRLAQAATLSPNPEWVVFFMLGGIFVSTFMIGYWQVVGHELV